MHAEPHVDPAIMIAAQLLATAIVGLLIVIWMDYLFPGKPRKRGPWTK